MDSTARREVLIVSSDSLTRAVNHDVLSAEGYECLLAADGHEGIEMFRGWRPPLIVTDVNLPILDGIELTRAVREEDPEAAVVVLYEPVTILDSRVPSDAYVRTLRSVCLKLGAYAVLEKPPDTEELLLATEGALYSRDIARKQRGLLKQRWTAVTPLATVWEMLAMYGTVFSLPARGLAQPPSEKREGLAPARGVTTVPREIRQSAHVEFGTQPLNRPRALADSHGRGRSVECGWCGLSNRPAARACWSCGLAPKTKSRNERHFMAA